MKYELIAVNKSKEQFEKEVADKLQQGYKLYKSPIVKVVYFKNGDTSSHTTYYYQAVTLGII